MNKNIIFKKVTWMKHNMLFRKIKVIGLILLILGLLCSSPMTVFSIMIHPLLIMAKQLINVSILIFISLYSYLGIKILSTKKVTSFKYLESMMLTRIVQEKMIRDSGNNSKDKYDIYNYNRKTVPKTFIIVTNDEAFCFYCETIPFSFDKLDKQNKKAIADHVSNVYSGHCGAWQSLNDNKYRNYFVNTVEIK